jgi:diacylglycerol kinase (ATP)
MTRSSELAIVLNPEAGGGSRYGSSRVQQLRAAAGSRAVVFSTGNRELVDAVAEGVRERGVGTVAIIGGDGTLSSVLSALHRAFGDAPLPRLALLRGGTMNTVANSLGIPRGRPEDLLKRLLSAKSGEVKRRATLRVQDRVGFLFSAGIMVGFLKALYAAAPNRSGALSALKLLGRGSLEALTGGRLIEQIETPLLATLALDGEAQPARRYTVLGAATVAQVGLGFRPFTLADECIDRFQVFAFHGSRQALVRQLPRIRRGLPIVQGLGFDPLAQRLEVDAGDAPVVYALDGEVCEARGTLTIEVGPQVDIRLF